MMPNLFKTRNKTDKEIIIIRGENRSCVYAPKLPKKDEGIIYHPHGF